jgi:hypothetical protein
LKVHTATTMAVRTAMCMQVSAATAMTTGLGDGEGGVRCRVLLLLLHTDHNAVERALWT